MVIFYGKLLNNQMVFHISVLVSPLLVESSAFFAFPNE